MTSWVESNSELSEVYLLFLNGLLDDSHFKWVVVKVLGSDLMLFNSLEARDYVLFPYGVLFDFWHLCQLSYIITNNIELQTHKNRFLKDSITFKPKHIVTYQMFEKKTFFCPKSREPTFSEAISIRITNNSKIYQDKDMYSDLYQWICSLWKDDP